MRNSGRFVWAAAMVLLLAACSNTKIVEQWADPSQTTPFKHVLVLSLNHSDAKRRVFETGFVDEIEKHGIEATASYELLPNKSDLSKETIQAAIAGTNIDAALVMRQVRVKKEDRYVPPTYDYIGDPYYGSFYGYYGRFAPIYTPGYITQDTIVHLETNLYREDDEKLVWSGKTETFNPSNTNSLIKELSKAIVDDLIKTRML